MQFGREIGAFVIVSLSEIQKVFPFVTDEYCKEYPDNLNEILTRFGCDVNKPIEVQTGLDHRNRLGEIVNCTRWACFERLDSDWVDSPWASREAKNKATGNRLLKDLNPYVNIPE